MAIKKWQAGIVSILFGFFAMSLYFEVAKFTFQLELIGQPLIAANIPYSIYILGVAYFLWAVVGYLFYYWATTGPKSQTFT